MKSIDHRGQHSTFAQLQAESTEKRIRFVLHRDETLASLPALRWRYRQAAVGKLVPFATFLVQERLQEWAELGLEERVR